MLPFSTHQSQRIRLLSLIILSGLLVTISMKSHAQSTKDHAYVDKSGVIRWGGTNEKVTGFGANYSVPFAHAYRNAIKLGVDPKEAIDNEVYHFSRLGFDLYRLHVWDTEISDILGNLLENEHLDVFDYLLSKLKENNINYVLTPIAFWGNGWPEPDEPTPGFSYKYGKGDCLTNPDAIKAQQNYLYQFLNHVNPYTKLAYKDDPSVIAFEVSNEPHHRGEGKVVTSFVKGMVKAMRRTGTKKPIFYNISHGVHFAEDYFKAGINGGTFQWYPTGLGYQREIPGNVLPNTNNYEIPFDDVIKKNGGAKLVYEFDAADVGRSYAYPAMARSFREAGIQIATHFAYDPSYLAYANTEYNTHYMNLAYAPHKALALAICAEIFREVPMYADQGTYPDNLNFGNFSISYENDVAIYNSPDKFIYTNTHSTLPKNEDQLQRILGHGNSTLVNYDGNGAYFLDKISDGVWRLEVMPDYLWVNNPFGRNSLKKTVGVVSWNERAMRLNLKNLGDSFIIESINSEQSLTTKIADESFSVTPGVYILNREGVARNWNPKDAFGAATLDTYFAPKQSLSENFFTHEPKVEVTEGNEVEINVQFIGKDIAKKINLITFEGWQRKVDKMKEITPFVYTATIPSNRVNTGTLAYYIDVELADGTHLSYPSGNAGQPFDWDFYDREPYTVRVVPKGYPIHLFDAQTDANVVVAPWRRTNKVVSTKNVNESEYQVNLDQLFVPDNENLNADPIYDYSFKHYLLDKIEGRIETLNDKSDLVIRARSTTDKNTPLQVALVTSSGMSFGKVITLTPEMKEYRIPLRELTEVNTVTLPRPYPTFLPFYFEHDIKDAFDINEIEALQFSIGPDLSEAQQKENQGVGIVWVRLE